MEQVKIHLDTDFGGDPDDACALAFLLGTPNVDLVGITTNLDVDGYRAGCARHYLELAGRLDVSVIPGAGTTLTDGRQYHSTAQDPRFWPRPIMPVQGSLEEALDLLARSIDHGATIVAIGAATNLALLEMRRPGTLARARVVFMGGWIRPPAGGLPQWGPEQDWNVQCDQRAAAMLANSGDLTLVTLPATLHVFLRRAHLERLTQSGPAGRLLALQSEVHASLRDFAGLSQEHHALPADLLNFHFDPLTAAVAVGWREAVIEDHTLRPVVRDGITRFEPGGGRPVHVVVNADGNAFTDLWLEAVERLG
jgi:inosine-uridine nucleoside N-ribohydrolase